MDADERKVLKNTFSLPPAEIAGVAAGMTLSQLVVAGFTFVVASVLATVNGPFMFLLVLPGFWVARKRIEGEPLLSFLAAWTRFVWRRMTGATTWWAAVPWADPDTGRAESWPMPPQLAGVALREAPDGKSGMVVSSKRGYVTVMFRVAGPTFGLLPTEDQTRLLGGWGQVLGSFCTGRSAVAQISVTELASSAPVAAHSAWVARQRGGTDSEAADYAALVGLHGGDTMDHEVVVAVTLDTSRVSGKIRSGVSWEQVVSERAIVDGEYLRSLLEARRMVVGPLFTASEIAEWVRRRVDPFAMAQRRDVAALGDFEMGVSPSNFGPLVTEELADRFGTDGALHSTYAVAEWPRSRVGPSWMTGLMRRDIGCPRAITMMFRPVGAVEARAKASADEMRVTVERRSKRRIGTVSSPELEAQAASVAAHRAELAAGYSAVEMLTLVTVTAPTNDELERCRDDMTTAALAVDIELRRLGGRQGAAFAAGLGIGAGPARGKTWV